METQELGNDWRRVIECKMIDVPRKGWAGAYDAIKAAITGKDLFLVGVPHTFSVYVKGDDKPVIFYPQIEKAESE